MNEKKTSTLMNIFSAISVPLAYRLGVPERHDELFSEMCYCLALQYDELRHKPFPYIIKICKNKAINRLFKGKSICSKPRKGVKVISLETCNNISSPKHDIARSAYRKKMVNKLLRKLSKREREVAEFLMEDYTEKEIAQKLGVTQQRVNFIKKKIRRKARNIIKPATKRSSDL